MTRCLQLLARMPSAGLRLSILAPSLREASCESGIFFGSAVRMGSSDDLRCGGDERVRATACV